MQWTNYRQISCEYKKLHVLSLLCVYIIVICSGWFKTYVLQWQTVGRKNCTMHKTQLEAWENNSFIWSRFHYSGMHLHCRRYLLRKSYTKMFLGDFKLTLYISLWFPDDLFNFQTIPKISKSSTYTTCSLLLQ